MYQFVIVVSFLLKTDGEMCCQTIAVVASLVFHIIVIVCTLKLLDMLPKVCFCVCELERDERGVQVGRYLYSHNSLCQHNVLTSKNALIDL
jgi:hypothetical protein